MNHNRLHTHVVAIQTNKQQNFKAKVVSFRIAGSFKGTTIVLGSIQPANYTGVLLIQYNIERNSNRHRKNAMCQSAQIKLKF
jgi:hypothetical protein